LNGAVVDRVVVFELLGSDHAGQMDDHVAWRKDGPLIGKRGEVSRERLHTAWEARRFTRCSHEGHDLVAAIHEMTTDVLPYESRRASDEDTQEVSSSSHNVRIESLAHAYGSRRYDAPTRSQRPP
jgi:hypothetical protein